MEEGLMASGQPFSEREKQFIRDNADCMSHGMIAHELSKRFPEDNGGYRSWRSVRSFRYRVSKSAVIQIRIPKAILHAATMAGINLEEIGSIATAGILAKIKTR
ncbi:MAG: hypothetical protein M0Q91_10000 [Methanoregula sp.]|nr:hypothetical protein [Methanoregula sp.]